MTNEEAARYALASGSCPECGHGILSHRMGKCVASVTPPPGFAGWIYCGCSAIQPPNSQGRQLMLHPEQKKFMETNEIVLWPGMGGRRP